MFPEQRHPNQALCLGVHCCISEVWIPGKQCTHLAPKKNYITMSMHLASELWVALATLTLHFLQCMIYGWQMVSLTDHEAKVSKYSLCPLSPSFSLFYFSFLILGIILNYFISQVIKLRLRKASKWQKRAKIRNHDLKTALIHKYWKRVRTTSPEALLESITFQWKTHSVNSIIDTIKM